VNRINSSERKMADSTATHLKPPTYDGKKEKFPMWITRLEAVASIKGFEDALSESTMGELPVTKAGADALDAKVTTDAPALKAVKMNKLAWAYLTMALQTEGLIALINSTKDTAWPTGVAWKAIKKLKEKYQPKDFVSKVELRRKLNAVYMKDNENPSVLFEKIASIKNAFAMNGHNIQEDELLATVMEKAPKSYSGILATETRIQANALTLQNLEDAMDAEFRIRYSGNESDTKNKGTELSLMVNDNFKGKCYKCGEVGHRAADCTKREADGYNGRKKFKGKCNNCGKYGHKKEDCWELDKNKSKRPDGYKVKSTTETGMTGANSGLSTDEEFMLLTNSTNNKEFLTGERLLEDPNLFIGDTGGTCDMTAHIIGLQNVQEAKKSDDSTDASGNTMRATKIGKVRGKICDKFGKEVQSVTLPNVAYMPNTKFNLFSISQRAQKGWKVEINKKEMTLTKGDQRVIFDIIIPTPKGALYCIYIKRDGELAATVKK
jgi:hypothetical protein